jgi:hypothetical protein
LFDFVLTYRSFASSFEVLEALVKRYETAPQSSSDQKIVTAVWLRVFNVLKHWIEKTWYDFVKDCPELSNRTIAFLDRVINENPSVRKVADGVKGNLVRKLAGEGAQISKTVGKTPKPFLPKDPVGPVMDVHPEELARQLTLIEWDIWVEIQPWECLDLGWMKKDKEKRAPHVLAMIERFNYVSGWVATSICSQESVKKRTKYISRCIEMADKLRNLGNLNGVMEIVSGLNRGPVYRLKQSWEGVSSSDRKLFEELKTITDRQKNYANMRKYLKKVNPPCIPYLGMYLTDLTFIEEGNKNKLGDLINFNKRHQISETIRAIKQYQQKPYALESVQFIQEKLQRERVYDEDTLYEMSEWLEPRPGKERGPKPVALGGGPQPKKRQTTTAAAPESEYKVELDFVRGYPYYAADTSTNLMMDTTTNSVKAGTLAKIAERLTHHATPDNNSLLAFFATFRIFATQHEVMDLLVARYNMPPPKEKAAEVLEEFKAKMQTPVYLRVFNAVKTWVDKHWYDFEDDQTLKAKLVEFANGPLLKNSPNFGKVLQTTIQKMESGAAQAANAPTTPPPPPKYPPPGLDASTACVLDFDSEEAARQLTLMQHKLWVEVRPKELLDGNFRGEERYAKAPNASRLLDFFANTRNWADTEMNHQRVLENPAVMLPQVVQKLIEIADYCYQFGNFQSMKAIHTAIDRNQAANNESLSPVHQKMYTEKQQLLDNADELREKLMTLSPPCVPPVDYMLHEIHKAEDRYGKNMLTDKLVNFEKWRAAGDVVVRIMSQQRMSYPYEAIPVIQDYFRIERQAIHSASVGGSSFMGGSGSGSISHSGNDTRLKFALIDMLLNDDDFKQEIKSVVSETFSGGIDRLKDEFRSLLAGKPLHSRDTPFFPTVGASPSLFASAPSNTPPTNIGGSPNPNSLSPSPMHSSPSVSHLPIQTRPSSALFPGGMPAPLVSSPSSGNIGMHPPHAQPPPAAPNTAPVTPAPTTPTPTPTPLPTGSNSPVLPVATPKNPMPSGVKLPMMGMMGMPKGPGALGNLGGSGGMKLPAAPPSGVKLPSLLSTPAQPTPAASASSPAPLVPTPTPVNQVVPPQNLPQLPSLPNNPPGPVPTSTPVTLPSLPPPPTHGGGTLPTFPPTPAATAGGLPPLPGTPPPGPSPTGLPQLPPTIPNLAQAGNRGSFTSAAKQPSIMNLMASLGKKVGAGPPSAGAPPTLPGGAPPKFGLPPSFPPSVVAPSQPQTPPPAPVEDASAGGGASGPVSPDDPLHHQARSVLEKDFPGCPLTTWEYNDQQGQIYGVPQSVSIEVLKKDKSNYICDIRHGVSVNDVSNLIKVGKVYRAQNPTSPLACIIITDSINDQAEDIAARCKIKVYKI